MSLAAVLDRLNHGVLAPAPGDVYLSNPALS
jgi:hypothetical protein